MNKIVYVLVVILLCACEGKDDAPTRRSSGNVTKQVIEKNIEELGTQSWSKQNYVEIRDNQISNMKGLASDKKALQAKLDITYCRVMVGDANKILDACTDKQHKLLNSIMTELKNFENAPGKSELESRKNKHDEIVKFIGSMWGKQTVRSLNDKYDDNFERDITTRANTYRATNPTCAYINNRLEKKSLDTCFGERRKDYATKLVDLYCSGDSYDKKVETSVKSKINTVLGSIPEELSKKIVDFKDKFPGN